MKALWLLVLCVLLPGTVCAQAVSDADKVQQLEAKVRELEQANAIMEKAAKSKPPAPAVTLTPAEQAARTQAALTDALAAAPGGAAAKACKAAKGKSYALIVVNGQLGWSCSIDLAKVKD